VFRQLPAPLPPGFDPPPLTFAEFVALYQIAFWCVTLLLPRPWFRWLLHVAFPFLPERLEDFGRKK
jgi:hypothetical protein